VDFFGWIGVGLGGNCDCRCGIVYAPMLRGGGGFAGLVSLTSTPFSSESYVPTLRNTLYEDRIDRVFRNVCT